eukprot:2455184-Rhodomonas_salina.5
MTILVLLAGEPSPFPVQWRQSLFDSHQLLVSRVSIAADLPGALGRGPAAEAEHESPEHVRLVYLVKVLPPLLLAVDPRGRWRTRSAGSGSGVPSSGGLHQAPQGKGAAPAPGAQPRGPRHARGTGTDWEQRRGRPREPGAAPPGPSPGPCQGSRSRRRRQPLQGAHDADLRRHRQRRRRRGLAGFPVRAHGLSAWLADARQSGGTCLPRRGVRLAHAGQSGASGCNVRSWVGHGPVGMARA